MAELGGEMITVRGRVISLPEGRDVFVGRDDTSESVYLRFTNCRGEKTRLKLSSEAAAALTRLLVHRNGGDEPQWRQVDP